jgi:hypothetical protein
MMYNKKIIDDILENKNRYFAKNIGSLYPDEKQECKVYEEQQESVNKVLCGEEPSGIVFTLFNNFSKWHLDYAEYQILYLNQIVEAQNEFVKSSVYGYLTVKKGKESAGCWISNVFLYMSKASFYMAQNILCGWWKNAWDIAEIIKISVDFNIISDEKGNKVKRIISCDESEIQASWFLLELFYKTKGLDFNCDNENYPVQMIPYDEVLKKWDTDDLIEINRLIYNMADWHLEQAKEQTNNFEFERPIVWLFPYEILTWLALRKQAGLENPTEYSHPLMNTPIAKMFLELKTPLPEPEELPYAEELIAKLIEDCQKMADETEVSKPIVEPKPVPKTGHYQATLPKEHPQAEALKADPQSYFTYNEGDYFSTTGLETYDIEKIEWVFVE